MRRHWRGNYLSSGDTTSIGNDHAKIFVTTFYPGHRYLQVEILVLKGQAHCPGITILSQHRSSFWPTHLRGGLGNCQMIMQILASYIITYKLISKSIAHVILGEHLLLIHQCTGTMSIYTCQTSVVSHIQKWPSGAWKNHNTGLITSRRKPKKDAETVLTYEKFY